MTADSQQQLEFTRDKLRLLEQAFAETKQTSKGTAHTRRVNPALASGTHQSTERGDRSPRGSFRNASSGSVRKTSLHLRGRSLFMSTRFGTRNPPSHRHSPVAWWRRHLSIVKISLRRNRPVE